MSKAKILIIEDDEDIRVSVSILLENAGYQIDTAGNGRDGLDKLTEDTDLVILDIMMPGISGLTVCKAIREKSKVPVLFLTAKAAETDKLIGLSVGADDYLTKPFSYIELQARVQAILRRYKEYDHISSTPTDKWIITKKLRINSITNDVQYDLHEIDLTDIEYRILRLLAAHPNRVYSVQNIYEAVWDEPFYYQCGNTVMVHIRNLREKLKTNEETSPIIKTVWGKGYCFTESTKNE